MYNIVNSIICCIYWDSKSLDFRNKELILELKLLNKSLEFSIALQDNVLVDHNPRGKLFYPINNILTLGIQNNDYYRLTYTVTMIIDVFYCLILENEPIRRG